MSACPTCAGPLSLARHGLLRDAHGAFLPASALRQPSAYATSAALRSSLAGAPEGALRCPSCRAAMQDTRAGDLAASGCPSCGGWWFARADLDAFRAAVLSRAQSKPRRVGGYGGTATSRAGGVAEGLFAVLREAGAFDA